MQGEQKHHFRVADFYFCITLTGESSRDINVIPSLKPFRIDQPEGEQPLFDLIVDQDLHPRPKAERERIRDFDTGNGVTVVDRLSDGGYQYIIRDLNGYDCCLMITNKSFSRCQCALNGTHIMKSYGLNSALMLCYAFAASAHEALLIHASLVRQHNYGYAFIAKSGTGKSTQVSMWLRYLPGCDLMNDDNPIVRIIDGQAYIYGSPWSGKTPCYRNVKARLGAIVRIERADHNEVVSLTPFEAFASLLPACSSMKWDETIYGNICATVSKLVEHEDIRTLRCLPNREAAEVCQRAVGKA